MLLWANKNMEENDEKNTFILALPLDGGFSDSWLHDCTVCAIRLCCVIRRAAIYIE
jgi:hypothetical protein